MTKLPPNVTGLPPSTGQYILDKWTQINQPTFPTPPFVPPFGTATPAPAAGTPAPAPATPNTDLLEGVWRTSNGTWRFIKDAQGYRFEETSAIGTSGQGRATLQNDQVHVDFDSSFLGRVSLDLTLSGNSMSGNYPMLGIVVPIYLQKIG
ncbi:hypothetical protein [Bradyrhizobium sp. Ce-3]|uniref:hypothetical protein n=1 Tax=Bradyrhizobium sp. Ce-3 TaxID=2913970 RepID=UPI001FBA1BFA|nr:hypothetical protein [Bradyrhizobium sp. Ce-3]GKQ50073.1 hypothetical protein BRSPCE3_09280 [Bradyrhizobium sp. Ce-3]